MKRIVILSNTSWYIYNFRFNLIKALMESKYQIITISSEDEYTTKLIQQGCMHYNIRIDSKSKNPLKDIVLMISLSILLRKIKPNVLLNYTAKPNIYGTIAASLFKIPTINNIAGLGSGFVDESLTTKFLRFLYRFSQKRANKIFFQNIDDQNEFINKRLVSREQCDLLPGSGVDLNRFAFTEISDVENDKFIFLFVARMLYSKGAKILFNAAKELKRRGIKNFKIILLGESNVNNNDAIPDEIIDQWNNEDFFEYLGKSDDVYQYMKQSNCIVLPTYYREGTPRSLLEGLATGRPIITTNMPGSRNTVINGINGYIIKPKDHLDLAEKMEKMLKLSQNELREFSISSRKLAEERFDESIVIAKYLKLIRELG